MNNSLPANKLKAALNELITISAEITKVFPQAQFELHFETDKYSLECATSYLPKTFIENNDQDYTVFWFDTGEGLATSATCKDVSSAISLAIAKLIQYEANK